MRKVTITAYGNASLQDISPTEGNVPGVTNSITLAGTQSTPETVVFTCTEKQFDTSVRPQLETLSQSRVKQVAGGAILNGGNTRPLLTWTQERVPGGRQRLHQIEGRPAVNTAGAQTFVARGANLIPGLAASGTLGSGTGLLTFTSVRKGPRGNATTVTLKAAAGAGSVTTTHNEDGSVLITVVPATGSADANAIKAQLDADAAASDVISTVSAGATATRIGSVTLSGGAGAGVAATRLLTDTAGSYLLVEAQLPGNTQNMLTVRTLTASGGGSVSVSGNDITVTPAAASNTLTAVAAQINGSATAKLLVKATVIGTGSTAFKTHSKTYLAGGSGELPVVTLGGVAVAVTKFTDSEIDFNVTGAALVTGGVAVNEVATLTVLSDFGTMSIGVLAVDTSTSTPYVGDLVASGNVHGATVQADNLTSGRVAVVSTAGLLIDDAGMVFDTSTNALTITGDYAGAGGFKTDIGGFTATLAATQSATKFLRSGMAAGSWCATHAGSVMGLSILASAAPTVSDVNFFVTINGTKVAAGTLVLTAGGGLRNSAAFAKDTAGLTFAAGDYVGICYDSLGTLGNTPTVIGDVVVEF